MVQEQSLSLQGLLILQHGVHPLAMFILQHQQRVLYLPVISPLLMGLITQKQDYQNQDIILLVVVKQTVQPLSPIQTLPHQ